VAAGGGVRELRTVRCDGSPRAAAELGAALAAALDGTGPPVLPLAAGDTDAPRTAEPAQSTAVVVRTSGSTGGPKDVELPAGALLASARATATRLGGPARWLFALPAEHVAGVQILVRALLAGVPAEVLDLRSGFRPERFAAAAARMGPGPRCTSLVPTQLVRVLDAAGPGLAALREFAAVLVGGAALDPGLRRRAEATGVRVTATYGMSETAGGCVYDGIPLPGVTVDLDAEGRILLGGPTLATGYLGRAAESAAAFAGGRFRTDDLGRWRDGRLEVLGRADDVIITGGEKVSPGAVERALAEQPGVRAACVVGVPDREWGQVVAAAVVPDPARPPDHGRLRHAVYTALGREAVPRRLLELPELPVRGIGKPDRAAILRLILTPRD
jgi:o-succinylbenzoate---CoA ligase